MIFCIVDEKYNIFIEKNVNNVQYREKLRSLEVVNNEKKNMLGPNIPAPQSQPIQT